MPSTSSSNGTRNKADDIWQNILGQASDDSFTKKSKSKSAKSSKDDDVHFINDDSSDEVKKSKRPREKEPKVASKPPAVKKKRLNDLNTDSEPEICDDPDYKARTSTSKSSKPKGNSVNFSDVNEIIDVGDDLNSIVIVLILIKQSFFY